MGTNAKARARRKRRRQHGVFCLECDWWHIKRKATIEPALQLLKSSGDLGFDYIHRNVGVKSAFDYYLEKWVQSGLSRYPILYLGFHGSPGHIFIGDGRRSEGNVPLESLANQLEGKCSRKLIHFGSCDTLRANKHQLNRFLRRTGALAVCGYQSEVDWFESIAFEILLLAKLQQVAMDRRGMPVIERWLKNDVAGLVRSLGFRFVAL